MARELRTILGLDITGFRRGLRVAVADVRRFGKDIAQPLARGVRDMAMWAAGLATVGAGFAALQVRNLMTAGDEIDKLNKRTGIATETLSRLVHAGKLSDVDIGDLQTGILTLQRNLYQAFSKPVPAPKAAPSARKPWQAGEKSTPTAQPAGEEARQDPVSRALADIGLSTARLRAMRPEDQLRAVMEALAGVQDQTVRAGAAMALFGRSGKQLLPMMASGADGLRRMMAEADRLGIVFNPRDVALSAQLNDNVVRLRGAWLGLVRSVGGLETINRAFQLLIAKLVAQRSNEGFRAFVSSVAQGAMNIVGNLASLAKALYDFNKQTGGGLLKLAAVFAGVALAFKFNLVVPLARLSALLITAVFGPLGAVIAAGLAGIAAGFAVFNLADTLARSLNVEYVLAEAIARLTGFARMVAAVFQSIGPGFASNLARALNIEPVLAKAFARLDGFAKTIGALFQNIGPGYAEAFRKNVSRIKAETEAAVQAINSAKPEPPETNPLADNIARIKSETEAAVSGIRATTPEAPSFSKAWSDSWKENIENVKRAAREAFGAMVPDSVEAFIDKVTNLKPIVLPPLNLDMPNIGANIRDGARAGIVDGLTGSSWGKVWTGDPMRNEARQSDVRAKDLREQLAEQKRTNAHLQRMANRGAMVFA